MFTRLTGFPSFTILGCLTATLFCVSGVNADCERPPAWCWCYPPPAPPAEPDTEAAIEREDSSLDREREDREDAPAPDCAGFAEELDALEVRVRALEKRLDIDGAADAPAADDPLRDIGRQVIERLLDRLLPRLFESLPETMPEAGADTEPPPPEPLDSELLYDVLSQQAETLQRQQELLEEIVAELRSDSDREIRPRAPPEDSRREERDNPRRREPRR